MSTARRPEADRALLAGDSGRASFCSSSGQVPVDPATGQIVGRATSAAQTRQVLSNIGAILEAAGASFADVVRTTVFLPDLDDFAGMNEVYGAFFTTPEPARSTVQVARLPRDARIEIDAIASLRFDSPKVFTRPSAPL